MNGRIIAAGLTAVALAVWAEFWILSRTTSYEVDPLVASARIEAERARIEARDGRRPVLYGESIAGEAWEGYEAAFALVEADEDLEPQLFPVNRAELTPEELRQLVDSHAQTLAQVRRGAHCERARGPMLRPGPQPLRVPGLVTTRTLANLAVAHALSLIADEQPVRAVETLLDAVQLGRDVANEPVMIQEMMGCAVLDLLLAEIASPQIFDALTAEARTRLAQGLHVLDENMPRVGDSIHGDVLFLADQTDIKGMEFDYFARLEHAARVLAAARKSWSVCDTFLTENDDAGCVPILVSRAAHSVIKQRLWTIARIRIQRMATEHSLGWDVPELADPFGGTLQHKIEDGTATFWSNHPEAEGLTLTR